MWDPYDKICIQQHKANKKTNILGFVKKFIYITIILLFSLNVKILLITTYIIFYKLITTNMVNLR